MNAERPTITLQTPLGKDLVINEYLTTAERRKIQAIFLRNAKQSFDAAGRPQMETSDNAQALFDSQDETIRAVVVSYDGSTEQIVERLMQLPSKEHAFVLDECEKVKKDPK